MKYRDLDLVDVSKDVEIVDGCVVFDDLKFSREEVEKLIKLFYKNLKRREDMKSKMKFEDFRGYVDEEINEIYDDLDYLVSSLNLL